MNICPMCLKDSEAVPVPSVAAQLFALNETLRLTIKRRENQNGWTQDRRPETDDMIRDLTKEILRISQQEKNNASPA